MSDTIPRQHVLFLTVPAFGHIIPLLELAKKTSQYHNVTFVVSASKVADLYKRELVSLEHENLTIIGLEDGVARDFDKPDQTPGLQRINQTVSEMTPSIEKLLRSIPVGQAKTDMGEAQITKPVQLVIAERFIANIMLTVCHSLGIPCVIFNASSGSSMRGGLDVSDETPVQPANTEEVRDRNSGEVMTEVRKEFLLNVNGNIGWATAIVINTFVGCDTRGVTALAAHPKTAHITVFCVGPIFPPEEKSQSNMLAAPNASNTSGESHLPDMLNSSKTAKTLTAEKVDRWLTRQAARSVVYVSLGSIAQPSKEQTEIMGNALLSLKQPFIFSLTQSLHAALPIEIRDRIASQFDDEGSQFLVLPWAPQKVILTHPSTGVFLTHAGWNSTLEGIVGGVPMVAWPMFADQHENGAWIVENGLGVLIPGTKMGPGGRLVPAEEITQAVQQAAKSRGKAEEMARAAEAAVAEGGSSRRDFLQLMRLDFSVKVERANAIKHV